MPLLYGSGKPLRLPGFVTGTETPGQQTRRLHDINEVLDKRAKEDEERKNRELFRQVEQRGDVKFSPPSPPRSQDTPAPLPGDEPSTKLGTLGRFEAYLESQLEGYSATFGGNALFGSRAYATLEDNALTSWREEQDFVPDDVVEERASAGLGGIGLLDRSRALHVEAERPLPTVDSKYDITIASITADVAAGFQKTGIPSEQGPLVFPGLGDEESLRFANEAVDEWLKALEGELRNLLPKDVDDQVVREHLYQVVRGQEILSDVLDEWGITGEDRQEPPQAAIDEALQRETEEFTAFFGEPPAGPGPLKALAGVAPGPLGDVVAALAIPGDPVLQLLEKAFTEKFIPIVDPTTGFQAAAGVRPDKDADVLKLASLDEVHRGGQRFADPAAQAALFGLAQPVRAGELGFEELTGVETTAVSGALQSQLAEDILSEAISPEFLLVALPGAGIGVKGLRGFPKLLRITANLTTGTDVGAARGFPLLRPSSAQAVFRGLTTVARAPLALGRVPQAVRNNPVFQRGLYNINAARAERVGRGLPYDEWQRAIGATDDAKLRRVLDAAEQGRLSPEADLPLRLAIDRELATAGGRSAEEIIERGLSPWGAGAAGSRARLVERQRALTDIIQEAEINPLTGRPVQEPQAVKTAARAAVEEEITAGRTAEELLDETATQIGQLAKGGDEVTEFMQSGEVASRGSLTQREALAEQRIFDTLARRDAPSHTELLRTVDAATVVDPELLPLATSGELFQLLQARRLVAGLSGKPLGKLKKAELIDLIDEAALPISKDISLSKMRADVKAARDLLKGVRGSLRERFFENLTTGDMSNLYMKRAEDVGDIPTQLVKDKSLEADKWNAFDPKVSPSERQSSLERYVAAVERKAAQFDPDTPVGYVGRTSNTVDAKLFRWENEAVFGNRPQGAVQGEVGANLKALTAKHLGTSEERLAALVPERAKFLTDGVDDFLFPWHEILDQKQLGRFRERLLTQMLDVEDGLEILDAGRQLEALFKIAKVGQTAKNKAYEALKVLTTHGDTPSPKQIQELRHVLEPVVGVGTTRELLNARRLSVKGRELILNTMGLPRSLMASADISALGRQGSLLGARYPRQWAAMAGRSIRAFWSPSYADSIRESIIHSGVIRLADGQTVDLYDFYRMVNGFLGSDAGQQGLRFSEETWMTSFASKWGWHLPRDVGGHLSLNPKAWEKIPFPVPLAQSERSYILPLDKMRMDFFKNTTRNLLKRGLGGGTEPTVKDFEQLALFINNASGRGNLPEWMDTWHPVLNALFFAPKLVVSRFAVTGDLLRHTARGGVMRRVVWETLAADAMTAGGALFMMNVALGAAGVGEVDFLNPIKKGEDGKWRTNSDWMKVKIGDETRIDFMASMLPVQRLMLGLGVAAFQGDGEMASRISQGFLRSKEAPLVSAATDVITGRDFVGGKIELTLDDLLGDVVASRVIPLSWQGPIEAVAASRGTIDVDIGPAILDLISDYKLNPDEALVASASLSAEMIGGGVVSFFDPGERLRERDNEKLQEMVANGEIQETEGQEINDMGDLDRIQATQVEAERGPEEKELEEKVAEQARWRDSEWIKDKDDEEDFHRDIRIDGHYTHPETGESVQLWQWPQDELDNQLRTHQIDGGTWNFRTNQNVSAEINVQRALFGHEEEEIEDIENPVDKALAEYWLIEPQMLPSGEYDYDAFKVEREAKQAEISKLVGDPKEVAEYFESFRDKDTDMQKDHRVAKEQRDTILDDTPMYMAGISDVTVNNLEAEIKNYLLSVGSSWGVARYIQWLYYQGEQYQTKEMAVTYWVASNERDMVINPQRTRMVLANEDLVLFYPGLFRGLTDEGKQSFVNRYDIRPLSKELQEEYIDTGEISRPGEGTGTQLFQSQAIFGRGG